MSTINRIIVIGASAGGFQAITDLVARIPKNTDTAVFGVLHLSKDSAPDIILKRLQDNTELTCCIPNDNDIIQPGYFYLAPANHHMMVDKGVIHINMGTHENRWRPSIDVLFRSAAANYTSRVIGIVLTGLLDDGTSGMSAIKRCGGICIVQEPSEAAYPDMPKNVINNVPVDYQVGIADIGYVLEDIFSKPLRDITPPPRDVQIEADITRRMAVSMDELKEIASHTIFTCPDCGGGLWHINNDVVHRYRCHTGHVYNEDVLVEKQKEAFEESIWISIRMLEERRNLLLTMSSHETESGHLDTALETRKRADEVNIHIKRLKELLGIAEERI